MWDVEVEPDVCMHDDSFLLATDVDGDPEVYWFCGTCNCLYNSEGMIVAVGVGCAYLRLLVSLRRTP